VDVLEPTSFGVRVERRPSPQRQDDLYSAEPSLSTHAVAAAIADRLAAAGDRRAALAAAVADRLRLRAGQAVAR